MDERLTPTQYLKDIRSRLLEIDLGCRECPDEHERTAQLAMMTNIMQTVLESGCLSEQDTEDGVTLMKWALAFPAVKSNPSAVLYCARSISVIQGVPTNAYVSELRCAYDADVALHHGETRRPGTVSKNRFWGPNRVALEKKWRPVIEKNTRSAVLRRAGVKALRTVLASMKQSDRQNVDEVLTAIMESDAFSAEEKEYVLGNRMP